MIQMKKKARNTPKTRLRVVKKRNGHIQRKIVAMSKSITLIHKCWGKPNLWWNPHWNSVKVLWDNLGRRQMLTILRQYIWIEIGKFWFKIISMSALIRQRMPPSNSGRSWMWWRYGFFNFITVPPQHVYLIESKAGMPRPNTFHSQKTDTRSL